jgi:hypothetical protein
MAGQQQGPAATDTLTACRPDALYRGQEAVIKRELITKMSSQD